MRVTVKVDTSTARKLRALGKSNELLRYTASTVQKLSDPYVPYQQGLLKNNTVISSDGSTLTYTQPYAHYQYYGKVMGPNYTNGERFWSGKAPKEYTGKDLTYHGAPMRGARWIERMLADKKGDVEKSIAAFVERELK